MIHWENACQDDLKLLESIKILLKGHEKLLDFLFHPSQARLKATGDELLTWSNSFSSGEFVLIQIALDIWDGSGHSLLMDLYQTLSDANREQVFKAIHHSKNK